MKAEVEPDPFRDLSFDITSITHGPPERRPTPPPPYSGRFALRVPRSTPPPILEDDTLDGWFR